MEFNIKSYGKINLLFKVVGKLSSGYHKIETIMQLVDLYDSIRFERLDEDTIIINSTNKELENEENLAYKAASLLKAKFNISSGIKISIEKNVPLASGLGGGSSNAATTLIALNRLWRLKLNESRLIQIASKLGSDLPFFIVGNAALVSGIGDKIKPIKKSHKMNIILINPGFKIYTKDAYALFDRAKKSRLKKPNSAAVAKSMAQNDFEEISSNLYNDFEGVILKKYPVLKEIKANLLKNRALNASLTGSGPTIFGIFESIYTAREAYYELKDSYPFVFLTKTV